MRHTSKTKHLDEMTGAGARLPIAGPDPLLLLLFVFIGLLGFLFGYLVGSGS